MQACLGRKWAAHASCRRVKPGDAWFEGCLSGVGDCAHATRPDLGQGGAMAVEVSSLREPSSPDHYTACLSPCLALCCT